MKGLSVLIVEDCHLMASALEVMLADAGAEIVAVAPSIAAALSAIERHPVDIACLDIDLGYETSFAVADTLALRGIPFVFVTAHQAHVVPPAHRGRPFIGKTEAHLDLVIACRAAAQSCVVSGGAGRPVPVSS